MERFEEAVIPLYLTACTVEGKTERTVQSYAETLRHFIRRAGRPTPTARLGCSSLQAGTCLSVHGLGAGARRERRYSAPETARGQSVLLLVPAHGLRRGETRSCGCRW